jgi:hypothetical protein
VHAAHGQEKRLTAKGSPALNFAALEYAQLCNKSSTCTFEARVRPTQIGEGKPIHIAAIVNTATLIISGGIYLIKAPGIPTNPGN